MPSMANLTLLNKAAANVTFSSVSPSAGDKSPARWRYEDATRPPSARVDLQLVARPNMDDSVRTCVLTLRVPYAYASTDTGLFGVAGREQFTVTFSVPQTFPQDLTDDAVAYIASAMGTTLVKDCFKAQVAPT